VDRRSFLAATGGTTAAVAVPIVARPRVGTSDVIRLRAGLDTLIALDDSRGGHEALKRAALAGAQEALGMQKLGATQRIRRRLFSVAADYTATAAWSAIDARQMDRAEPLLDRALYLAGMGQDPVAEFKVWNSCSMLARMREDTTQAVDSGLAALSTTITRRDPFYSSLAHARTAVAYAYAGERQPATRHLGYAQEAMDRSAQEPRPSWMAFYGPAELTAMTAIVRDRIGNYAEAEAASHKALGTIPKEFRRNRALATTRLSLAQLHQREGVPPEKWTPIPVLMRQV
jgi:hypothetical protein